MLELDGREHRVLKVSGNRSEDVNCVTGDKQRHFLDLSFHVTQTRAVHLEKDGCSF